MIDVEFRSIKDGTNLNSTYRTEQFSGFSFKDSRQHWQDFAHPDYGFPAVKHIRPSPCPELFHIIAFAQLIYRESLRCIEIYLIA